MLALLSLPSKVINLTANVTNYDLYTAAGSPTYPMNLYMFVNAKIDSNNTSNAALLISSSWKNGSIIYIKNNNTIQGATGATGNTGAAGANGAGGAGGSFDTTGSNGGNGANGDIGSIGGTGGLAIEVNSNTAVKIIFDNSSGNIIGGSGGSGGAGGAGGTGGGGGGGGGGSYSI